MIKAPAWTCGAFVALYFAVVLSQLNHGLASLDAHGIIRVVQSLIDNHKIDISRPPGHPTTEFYLFGATAWALHLIGHPFGEHVYLLGQAVAAIATLLLFYNLLRSLNVAPWPACIAVVCLALSPQFFANAIDGEEFIFALFFILLTVRLLVAHRLSMSILSFAFATGCRPEMIFAGLMFPIYLLCARAGRKGALVTLAMLPLTIVIVWLPVLLSGVHPPYDARMNLKQALLVGGYKLLFQCFGIVVFILLLIVLASACVELRTRWRAIFPRNFIAALVCILPLFFFALFFRYATKPAYVLVALPFLLMMATESRARLCAVVIFSAVQFFVKIDIFKDRQLTRPFIAQGSGIDAIAQKPFYRLSYLRGAAAQCRGDRTVIVADAAPWDFEYHIKRGTFPAEEKLDAMQRIPVFIPQTAASCILMPRDGAFARAVLENWRAAGYQVKMDAALYRTAFARYDVNRPNDPADFELFSVKP